MKRVMAVVLTLAFVFALAACGVKPTDEPAVKSEADAVQEKEKETQTDADRAAAVYAAFLGQYEAFSTGSYNTFCVRDFNEDGYPEIIARTAKWEDGEIYDTGNEFMATYTDKAGLSVIYPNAHSFMGVHFYVSDENCLYHSDDGHNVGTSHHHVGFVYSVDDTGFVLLGQAFGDEWTEKDVDSNDLDVMGKLDEKYDRIFTEKMHAIAGDISFTDCMDMQMPQDLDACLNEALGIDIAAARRSYTDAQTRLQKAIADAAGKEPQFVWVSDYDRDGTYEAFGFFEEEKMSGISVGPVWFVNAQGEAEQIMEYASAIEEMGRLSCTWHDYFQAPLLVGGSTSPTTVWVVRDGACRQVELFDVSKTELEIVTPTYSEYLQSNTLISTLSASDMSLGTVDEETGERHGGGHSHKPYFFRDTPDGIREYGGMEISLSDVEKIEGGKEMIALAQADGRKIDSIYYRENGVVNFSMSVPSGEGVVDCTYINALLVENKLWLMDYEMNRVFSEYNTYLGNGAYTAAVCPEKATFPETLP